MTSTSKPRTRALALFVGCMVGLGCPGQAPPPPGPRPYTARIVREVAVLLPEGYAATLTPDQRAEIDASGGVLDEAANLIDFGRAPLRGRFIKVGEELFLTQDDGSFHIPALADDVTELALYRDTEDAASEALLPVLPAGFSTVPEEMPEYVRQELLPPPLSMEDPLEEHSEKHAHEAAEKVGDVLDPEGCTAKCSAGAAKVTHDEEGCCLDYDSTAGDGKPREREHPNKICQQRAYTNFLPNSVCAQWSIPGLLLGKGTACNGEAAYQCASVPGVRDAPPACAKDLSKRKACTKNADCTDGLGCFGGRCSYPLCYQNHKFRNCQNMDSKDFSATPDRTVVGPGAKVVIKLRNNTEANETVISGVADGKVEVTNGLTFLAGKQETHAAGPQGPSSTPRPDGLTVLHYSNARRRHYSTVNLMYTAPAATSCGDTPVTITFSAANSSLLGPAKVQVSLIVRRGGQDPVHSNGGRSRSAVEETCPVDPPPTPLSDVLSLSGVANNWALGDEIAPGPGNLDGTMFPGGLDVIYGVGTGQVEASGAFTFVVDCTEGGGPCVNARPFGTDRCGGDVVNSNPDLKVVTLDEITVDVLFVEEQHFRPGGFLLLSPERPFSSTLLGPDAPDLYYYFWADREGSVTGACLGTPVDLRLHRGWNPVRRHLGVFTTAAVPVEAQWWLYNVNTSEP